MKRMSTVVIAYLLFFSTPSVAQEMDKHMEGHMGKGPATSTQNTEDKNARKNHATGAWHIREAEEAGVKVKVTYKNPGKGKGPVFAVVLDTHSVDLDRYRLDEAAVLMDDSGKEYKAAQVSATGSGHHREGVLEFKDADISTARSVKLVVKGVAGVKERVFRFDLQR